MSISGLLFLLITHFLCGWGLLQLFNIKMKPVLTISLSMIVGVVLFSFLPLLLQFFYIPITVTSVLITILVATIVLNIKTIIHFKSLEKPKKIKWPQLYEYPFLIILLIIIVSSVWRCFYFPPYARDMLSGPEALAEFTVREHTLLNSIFSVDLESTNNHLKTPYVADLQIIYKLFVYQFGQLWLSVLFVSFIVWIYALLKEKLHPIIAGAAVFCFIAMPDVYAYTYIILFDYSNMIFYFAGFYFFILYADSKQLNQFLFSCLLFGFATFIRPETLVLLGMTIPLVVYTLWKEHLPAKKIIFRSAIFLLIPFFFYFIWMDIFLKYYMPVPFSVKDQINKNLMDFSMFFTRFGDLNSKLMFGRVSPLIYGYFMDIFVFLLIVDLVIFRRVNREGRILLYGIVVVYIGLPFLGYLIPWVDFWDTTKRGIYKMFPLMLLYMRDSQLLQRISDGIKSWEFAKAKPVPAVATAKAGKVGQAVTQTKNKPNNQGSNGKANQKKKK